MGIGWAVMILLATLWLRRFHRGPVEWLWHAMYYKAVAWSFPAVQRWHRDRGREVAR